MQQILLWQKRKVILKIRRYFRWSEFDKSVDHISNKCDPLKFSWIYLVHQGVLCIALALSHQLKNKLLKEPKNNISKVYDFYKTRFTLKIIEK